MWKRDEAVKPPAPPLRPPPAAAVPRPLRQWPQPSMSARPSGARDIVHIGKSVVIKGELNGSEDLTIEGHVEGKIELRDHVLTIGPNGKIRAEVFAKAAIVARRGRRQRHRTEKVDIRDNGSVDGDIISPRVAIAEGAHFRGSVDMKRGGRRGHRRPKSRRPTPSRRGRRHRLVTQKVGV